MILFFKDFYMILYDIYMILYDSYYMCIGFCVTLCCFYVIVYRILPSYRREIVGHFCYPALWPWQAVCWLNPGNCSYKKVPIYHGTILYDFMWFFLISLVFLLIFLDFDKQVNRSLKIIENPRNLRKSLKNQENPGKSKNIRKML